MSICANQIGQHAALYGLENMSDFVADDRRAILKKQELARRALNTGALKLRSLGAYFAFAEHGFDMDATTLCQRLVAEQGLLLLPGAMFAPDTAEFHDLAARTLRIAFANADAAGIRECAARIAGFAP